MSTQTLQPLIWLARRWTRSRVFFGIVPFSIAALSAMNAFMASGTSMAGFFIRACMMVMAVIEWTREARGAEAPGFGARFVRLTGEERALIEGFVRQRAPMQHDA